MSSVCNDALQRIRVNIWTASSVVSVSVTVSSVTLRDYFISNDYLTALIIIIYDYFRYKIPRLLFDRSPFFTPWISVISILSRCVERSALILKKESHHYLPTCFWHILHFLGVVLISIYFNVKPEIQCVPHFFWLLRISYLQTNCHEAAFTPLY